MSDFLVNKVINEIKIAEDKKALLFKCDDGEHIVKTEGDCCSSTWVQNIELPAMGFPCKVVKVENLELPNSEWDRESEYIQFYGCKIVTDKGDIIINYRNESNGYYGGNLSWPDDKYFKEGALNQNVSEMNWKGITEDI